MTEWLQVFDHRGNPLDVKERTEVHFEGDWHETFQCWLYEMDADGQLYLFFQKRAADKAEFPSLYDISAAGHIEAGENIMQAGMREIDEELGISLWKEDLKSIGTYKEVLISDTLKDRELCRVYLSPYSAEKAFSLGKEVEDLVRVEINGFKQVLGGAKGSIEASSVIDNQKVRVGFRDFVPHDQAYYEFVIQAILEEVEKL
ncbi:NUDIX domain-containing protein [Halobacillus alkaliphilus]|uniref:NUDIX domain-containing protein n=1 Tax=Halobacillus alkaliphilus TaxID=396056 RepID=A0A1I2RHH9_9BACI|nr:NUDIX domain-containing protein [Halobacillus alkaliphilus]SFG40114.1 NUDIX domain-containing protein [Halobacillus alkaliphilus]